MGPSGKFVKRLLNITHPTISTQRPPLGNSMKSYPRIPDSRSTPLETVTAGREDRAFSHFILFVESTKCITYQACFPNFLDVLSPSEVWKMQKSAK